MALIVENSDGQWNLIEFNGNTKNDAEILIDSNEGRFGSKKGFWKSFLSSLGLGGWKTLYIKGDFTKSLKYAEENKSSYNGKYNLFTKNCLHFVRNALRQGKCNNDLLQLYFKCSITIIPRVFFDNASIISKMRFTVLWRNRIIRGYYAKKGLFILLLSLVLVFIVCVQLVRRKQCLNYENFDKFYYNNHLYIRPVNNTDIYKNYSFYGEKHKVGYTIGVYNKVFETFVLDTDTEENILFQEYGIYFWFKEGFEFPDVTNMNISKLLIEKADYWGDNIEGKEYLLGNIPLNDLFVEYNVNSTEDSPLLDYHNFSKYRIRYLYDGGILTNYYNRFAIYNERTFVENINSFGERKIYVLNGSYAPSVYEFIMKNFND